MQEVQARGAEAPARALHLGHAGVPAARPHLGGEEQPVGDAQLRREVADHRLRRPVHRGGVHHAAGQGDEAPEDLPERRALGAARAHVEAAPGAEPHGGDALAAGRDRALEHRGGGGRPLRASG